MGLAIHIFLKASENTMNILTETQHCFMYLIQRKFNDMIDRLIPTMIPIESNVKYFKIIVYTDILPLFTSKTKYIAVDSLVDDYKNMSSCIQEYKKATAHTHIPINEEPLN